MGNGRMTHFERHLVVQICGWMENMRVEGVAEPTDRQLFVRFCAALNTLGGPLAYLGQDDAHRISGAK
jgi:hypothetical protein